MDKNLPKICFLADSHDLYDDRIYWKEACSLARAGFEVHYILAGDHQEEGTTAEGIHFYTIRKDISGNRYLNYILKRYNRKGLYPCMLKAAEATKAEVFHLHDLKLLSLVEALKKLPNKPKVVYDVHEPYPENIVDYEHGIANGVLRKRYAAWIRKWEKRQSAMCDLIITTEENLQQRFKEYFPGTPVEIIYNYSNFDYHTADDSPVKKEYDAIYTGGITKLRGAINILKAITMVREKLPTFRMLFIGTWFPPELKSEMKDFVTSHDLRDHVVMNDSVPYNEVVSFYGKSKIGLGIFLPIPTHRIILQIKIFEYMNMGLPIVGSNFGHISEIIQKHHCGIVVDPESPDEIAAALVKLLSEDEVYRQLSQNGRQAAEKHFKWELMEKKLTGIYQKLIS